MARTVQFWKYQSYFLEVGKTTRCQWFKLCNIVFLFWKIFQFDLGKSEIKTYLESGVGKNILKEIEKLLFIFIPVL